MRALEDFVLAVMMWMWWEVGPGWISNERVRSETFGSGKRVMWMWIGMESVR